MLLFKYLYACSQFRVALVVADELLVLGYAASNDAIDELDDVEGHQEAKAGQLRR